MDIQCPSQSDTITHHTADWSISDGADTRWSFTDPLLWQRGLLLGDELQLDLSDVTVSIDHGCMVIQLVCEGKILFVGFPSVSSCHQTLGSLMFLLQHTEESDHPKQQDNSSSTCHGNRQLIATEPVPQTMMFPDWMSSSLWLKLVVVVQCVWIRLESMKAIVYMAATTVHTITHNMYSRGQVYLLVADHVKLHHQHVCDVCVWLHTQLYDELLVNHQPLAHVLVYNRLQAAKMLCYPLKVVTHQERHMDLNCSVVDTGRFILLLFDRRPGPVYLFSSVVNTPTQA